MAAASSPPDRPQTKPAHATIAIKLKMRRCARQFALQPTVTHDYRCERSASQSGFQAIVRRSTCLAGISASYDLQEVANARFVGLAFRRCGSLLRRCAFQCAPFRASRPRCSRRCRSWLRPREPDPGREIPCFHRGVAVDNMMNWAAVEPSDPNRFAFPAFGARTMKRPARCCAMSPPPASISCG